jgi:hypothetical protein
VPADSASPAQFLRSIINGVLPPGESAEIIETRAGTNVYVLTVMPGSRRACGLLLGRLGATMDAIRKLLNVHAGSRGLRVNVSLLNDEERETERENVGVAAVR